MKYPFIKCLHPVRIKHKNTGEWMYVGCGKCPSCKNLRSSQLTLKCNLESRSHEYCHFITLTYDDTFVPVCAPIAVHGTQGKEYHLVSLCRRTGEFGNVLATVSLRESLIDRLYKKLGTDYGIPYLSRRDVQLFIKRLRKLIKTECNENIRFFVCGEYGPKHLRPHYHLLVWHSDRQTSEKMADFVCKAWKFGYTDIQLSNGNATNYVASYVNSLGTLPDIYTKGQLKPFSGHSNFLGEKFYRNQGKKIYSLSATEFIRRSERINDSLSEFTLWRSLKDTFYPKCRGYATSSSSERQFLYTLYAQFCGRKKTHRQPYQLAREILKEIEEVFYSWDLPFDDLAKAAMYYDGQFRWSATHAKFIDAQQLFSDGLMVESEFMDVCCDYIAERERILGVIYRDLSLSKRFLEFVCNSDDPIEIQCKINMIEHFYNSLELASLNDQYESQSEMLDTGAIDYEDLEFYYDNMNVSNLLDSRIYKAYKKYIIEKSREHMKHKIQNDANRRLFSEVGLL